MRKCYFCGTTKGLKGIWIEDEEMENHSCCMNCFNNPDNGMEECPISGIEWLRTDYNWKPKRQIVNQLS